MHAIQLSNRYTHRILSTSGLALECAAQGSNNTSLPEHQFAHPGMPGRRDMPICFYLRNGYSLTVAVTNNNDFGASVVLFAK